MLAALARISHPHRRIQTAATFRSVQEGVIGWVSNQECHILNPVHHIILVLIPQLWSLSLAKSAVNDRLKRAAAETRKCNFENVHENPAGRPPPDLVWEPGVDWFWRLAWDSGWVLSCLAIWLRLFSQTILSPPDDCVIQNRLFSQTIHCPDDCVKYFQILEENELFVPSDDDDDDWLLFWQIWNK